MSEEKSILVIAHHGPEDIGIAGEVLTAAGYSLETRNRMQGDSLPALANGYAGAVVLGGIMSANDDHLDGIRDELNWLEGAMASGKPLLGICLGSQLIARAAGARVAKHAENLWEIGYHPIETTEDSTTFGTLPPSVYGWHEDGFELPAGAELLARGTIFPNQAYSIGKTIFATQFHPEVTPEMFTGWMKSAPGFEDLPGAQSREVQLEGAANHHDSIEDWFSGFLRRWIKSDVEG